MKTISLFECNVACLNMSNSLREIERLIENKIYTQHVVLNASKVVLLKENERLKKIIQDCAFINADGQSIIWASKFIGTPLPERVAGIDLMQNLIELSVKKKYRIYFLGAKEEVVKKVINHYQSVYPSIVIAGYHNGYFDKNNDKHIVNDIKNSNADILFVAFSSPQKELWLSKHGENLQVPFVMGVGGSFDVVAGITRRAPEWMQKYGLEWFYRFLQEPTRMWKRYLLGNSKFLYYTIKEKQKKVS